MVLFGDGKGASWDREGKEMPGSKNSRKSILARRGTNENNPEQQHKYAKQGIELAGKKETRGGVIPRKKDPKDSSSFVGEENALRLSN